ncbi:MAG TPA: PQQ-binding-like beta-propeller repeat protein, partial [Pirellulales bacterium]|nr:PQQ-binding-like beta-propeller repeat protein [Pirellulales bacterium]
GLVAYHTKSGERAWNAACGTNSYSSPQRATLCGEEQIVMASDQMLIAVKPDSGELLWEFSMGNSITMPEIQPHVVGDAQLLIQAGTGLKLLELSHDDGKWSANAAWKSQALRSSFNDLMVFSGAAYGFDEGIFGCLDLKTGKRRWKRGRYSHGQAVLLAEQQLLVVLSEGGEAVLVAADPDQFRELGRFQAIEGKCWNYPLIAGGRLYVRNGEEAACYVIGE